MLSFLILACFVLTILSTQSLGFDLNGPTFQAYGLKLVKNGEVMNCGNDIDQQCFKIQPSVYNISIPDLNDQLIISCDQQDNCSFPFSFEIGKNVSFTIDCLSQYGYYKDSSVYLTIGYQNDLINGITFGNFIVGGKDVEAKWEDDQNYTSSQELSIYPFYQNSQPKYSSIRAQNLEVVCLY